MKHENDVVEIDLRELMHVLKKRILIILLSAVIFAGAAGIYIFFVATPVYESTASLYILTQSTSITSLADIQMGSSLAVDYVELIKSRPVVSQVRKNLNLDLSNAALLNMLTLENPADTRIIRITVRGSDKAQNTAIANEFASIAKRQISSIMKTDEPTTVENAVDPKSPIAPDKQKNIMMGFLLGALLSAGVVIAMHLLNDSIRNREDVERYLGLNTLAEIPLEGGTDPKKFDKVKKKRAKA